MLKLLESEQLLLRLFIKSKDEEAGFRRLVIKDINKLSGQRKNRIIYAPNRKMRELHKKIIWFIRRQLRPKLEYATAGEKGCSPIKHIKSHRHNRYFYITDLKQAYQNVNGNKLALLMLEAAEEIGLAIELDKTKQTLDDYCLAPEGGLATGAPASPVLFNFYASRLIDQPLSDYLKNLEQNFPDLILTYTRYLDDIIVSSNKSIGKKKRQEIMRMINKAGFEINYRKTQVLDIRKKPIKICGFGLESGGRIFLPRSYRQRIHGLLHCALDLEISRLEKQINGYFGLFKMSLVNEKKMKKEKRILDFHYIFKSQRLKQKRYLRRQKRIGQRLINAGPHH